MVAYWFPVSVGAAKEGTALSDEPSFEGSGAVQPVSGAPALTTLPSQALSAPDPEQDRLQGLEDKILATAMTTVDDAGYWHELYGAGEDGERLKAPPQEWIDELGKRAAWRRFRVAMAACQNAKAAPVGLGMARATFMGITKVRAARNVGAPSLSIQFVNFPAPVLEVIDVEGE